ncbi:MAG TPA: hypothetical protein DCQ50_07940 [Chryseobacterium sp.]|nr:hypothetical protein [Chryseobacterium sp.]
MTTKLTLTIDKDVIERAKIYAKGTQRSLSEMVQKYLESCADNNIKNQKKSSALQKLAGSLPLPDDFDDKKALDEYYAKKYNI